MCPKGRPRPPVGVWIEQARILFDATICCEVARNKAHEPPTESLAGFPVAALGGLLGGVLPGSCQLAEAQHAQHKEVLAPWRRS